MRLRLYHHPDGARVAYREAGTGPPLVLLHATGLSHREWEPVVEPLAARFRVVLPDLPLHGDSEDRPRHPFTPEWLAEVIGRFCAETAGPRAFVGGHGAGAEIALRAVETGTLSPRRLVLLPNSLHRAPEGPTGGWRTIGRLAGAPGLAGPMSRVAAMAARPAMADRRCVTPDPAARDLIRHAFADVAGDATRARAWSRAIRAWPTEPRRELLDAYATITAPTLLLWADRDVYHPLAGAQEAVDLMPDAQLRVLSDTGHLITFDDPVGVAREIAAFCR